MHAKVPGRARSRSQVQGLRRYGYSSGYSLKGGRGRGQGVKRDTDISGPGQGLHRGRGGNPLLQEFQQRLPAIAEGPWHRSPPCQHVWPPGLWLQEVRVTPPPASDRDHESGPCLHHWRLRAWWNMKGRGKGKMGQLRHNMSWHN